MCDKSGLSNFVRKQLLLRGRMHKKMRLHGAPLRRALVASLCFLPSADAFYNIFSPSSAEVQSLDLSALVFARIWSTCPCASQHIALCSHSAL